MGVDRLLTPKDEKILGLCKEISDAIITSIAGLIQQKAFLQEYGKISRSRSAGGGRGAGKLQRDATSTRGNAGQNPFSNRNFRWHPLVISSNESSIAKSIEKININNDKASPSLIFVIKENAQVVSCSLNEIYQLGERYTVLPIHWQEHKSKLSEWKKELWDKNSCAIPIYEACEWYDAVEVYAVLGISIAVAFFKAEFTPLYNKVKKILKNQEIEPQYQLPSNNFPTDEDEFIKCPICRKKIFEDLDEFRNSDRGQKWKPSWKQDKAKEGEDSSIQVMHVKPLIESEIRHNAANVRYGHRWCNVVMTDHSLEETLNFMDFVVKSHKGR